MPVARDVEIITICNSQALPRVFLFFFFFKAMSDPVLGALDISSHFNFSIAP